MSLCELLYIGHTPGNNRRGLRLPLLLGRLHLGLIFSGPCSSSSGRKASSEKCSLRSFLFIATVLITKCGSSSFPNRNSQPNIDTTASAPASSSTLAPDILQDDDNMFFYLLAKKHLKDTSTSPHDDDLQDHPLQHILSIQTKGHGPTHFVNGHYIEGPTENVKTIGYVLKGMILPMLISLTLSFGFVIYKNRVKRARLQAIQSSLEAARLNPNQLLPPPRALGGGGLVSNALLSVLETRGEWSLVSGGEVPLENDDYVGEGGETARHKPYLYDKPPDYASVFDPPTYEQATAATSVVTGFPLSNRSGPNAVVIPTISIVDSNAENCENENEQLLPFSSASSMHGDWEAGDDGDDGDNDMNVQLIASGVFSSLFD